MIVPNTLTDWIQVIEREVMFVDVKPYSHNIINLALQAIANEHGRQVANKVVVDCNLEPLGWKQEQL